MNNRRCRGSSKYRLLRIVCGGCGFDYLTAHTMRVLHLTSQPPDFQAEYAAQLLAPNLSSDVEVVARQLGRNGTGRNALSSLCWLWKSADEIDVIHAWDFASARLAAISRPGVIFGPSEDLLPGEARWIKYLAHYTGLQIVCPAPAHRRELLERGIPPGALHVASLPVRLPAYPERNEELRRSLGLSPDDHVVLAPGESTRAAGHRYALWATSILHVLDPRWRLLIWGRGPLVQSLQNLSERFRQPRVLRVAEQTLGRPMQFEELLPAAELALVTPTGLAAPLPIQICMAAGLPIVAAASPTTKDLLIDQVNASIVPRLSPRLLAQRVLALSEDEQTRRRLGQQARRSITSDDNAFFELHRSLYRKSAAQKI